MLEVTFDPRDVRAATRVPGPARKSGRPEPYLQPGVEPTLEDLLNDPMTQALMACDRVSSARLRSLIAETKAQLRNR